MTSNTEITVLSKKEIFGKTAIRTIKKIGINCAASDFAILLGATVKDDTHIVGDKTLKGRTCAWICKPGKNGASIITEEGNLPISGSNTRFAGIRPAIYCNQAAFQNVTIKPGNIIETIYGEYPQYAVDNQLAKVLNNKLADGTLKETGKYYTSDSRYWDEQSRNFMQREYAEYIFNGKKYIYMYSLVSEQVLSNGQEVKHDDVVWIEVSPITWLVDQESKIMLSKIVLASGIRSCDTNLKTDNFTDTELYMFLNNYFAKEIIQSFQIKEEINKSKTLKKKNIYGFNMDEVSEEDIIRGNIEAGVAVFLHGRSSEGKSARVKQIDPTCEIIYLRNATPESLNGKSVYKESTGEMIDIKPTWLKRLEEKCAKEPYRFHVVFFDELTNALPSIQGMAFNIVLDREVNGMWKLPDNARIVAAGNDMDDSLAANQLAEPLFNRFSHVYIKTTKDNWLKWAIENNIHPAIVSYIAYNGEKALRTEYNGETPNADPRKWEMASKMLYATRNPEMLRALVGEDITKEFIAFCKQRVITLSDVLSDNYTIDDIKKLNTSERFATITGLTCVNDDSLEKVRKFTTKIGLEYTALFDSLWSHGDLKRLERLAELSLDEEIDLEQKQFIDKIELSLLSTRQTHGISDNGIILCDPLDIIEKYGYGAAITDLAILTGGYFNINVECHVKDDNSLKGRTCSYMTLSPYVMGDIRIVSKNGVVRRMSSCNRYGTIRPVITKESGIWSEAYSRKKEGYDHMYEAEFGEYPQYVPDYIIQKKLEEEYLHNRLIKTRITYTFDSVKANDYEAPFTPVTYDEYEYNDKKYIRVKNNAGDHKLSDGNVYNTGSFVWIEISPVIWLIDYQKELLVSKRGLLSGIRFDDQEGCYNGDFTKTELYEYMNTYMKHDLFQGESLKYVDEKRRKLIKK